jgi:polar amino acid transport system substrate-binding protein
MKRILAILCAITLAMLLLAGCGKPAEKGATITPGVFTVGCEVGYPPMEYTTKDGMTAIGFDIDVGKAIAELLGLEWRIVNTSWDGIFVGLEKGQYDCIISAVSITPERAEKYILTQPYVANALCIVTNASDTAIDSPAKFEGRKISAQSDTTASDDLDKMIEAGANIDVYRYEKVTQCFDDLKLGRVDAVYVDSVVAAFYTKDDVSFRRTWISDVPEPMGICLAKGSTQLAAAVEAAIDTLNYTGQMNEIAMKNFGDDFTAGLRTVTEMPVIPALD